MNMCTKIFSVLAMFSLMSLCYAVAPVTPVTPATATIDQLQHDIATVKIKLESLMAQRDKVATEQERAAIRDQIYSLGDQLSTLEKRVAAQAKAQGVATDRQEQGTWASIKKAIGF